MIEILATRPTYTTVAVALGAAMLAGSYQYPPRIEAYELHKARGTHSDFNDRLARPVGFDNFAQQVAEIYNGFAKRQERLGSEFEAAIFGDLESLYEA
jgi:hypothetical protein